MKKTLVWILVAANLSLAGTLAWRGIGANTANAQVPRPPQPGKYILIPGDSQIGVSIVYVFDSENHRVGAIAPDSKDMMVGMPTINLDQIMAAYEAGQMPNPGNRSATNGPGGNGVGQGNGGNNRPGGRPN